MRRLIAVSSLVLLLPGACTSDGGEPVATGTGTPSGATAATGQPWDFKLLIHALHASTYSYGGETLPAITYPGYLNDCEACHLPGTYYPVDPIAVFATSVDAGAEMLPRSPDVSSGAVSACSGLRTFWPLK